VTDTTERTEEKTPEPTPAEQRTALVRLLAFLGFAAFLAVATGTWKTVAVVVALIVMIMLHELGHFLTARWGGMKATEFFLGFGPRLWSVRKGETEFGVKAIPAGGYVKILGMHNLDRIEDPADEPRTYRQQSFLRRLSVAVSGSGMHFLLALTLLFTVNAIVGVPAPTLEVGNISKLEAGPSPAEEAGFRLGDRIVAVDGQRFDEWDDLPPYIRSRPGQELRFTVERDGQQVELVARPIDLQQVKPAEADVPPVDRPTGFIGIGPDIGFERVNPLVAAGRSVKQLGVGLWEVLKALGGIFSPSGVGSYFDVLTDNPAAGGDGGDTRFLSPVGFVRMASQAADTGIFEVLQLLIAINLFVGVFNLLPLLPLDGGHVAIAVYEAIRTKIARRRYYVDVTKLMPATYLVFMVLVFLGVTSLYLDITRPLNNPFQ
jgi:membrane-associated protease RseP (regulator of RpoE activity)